MQISRLQDYLDEDKNYLITNDSDIKYLLGDAYFKNVEILVKKRVICILADTLNIGTISQALGGLYEVFDTRKPEVVKELFNSIDTLVINPEEISMGRETRLLGIGVGYLGGEGSLLTEMRNIKQEDELELLRKSQQINIEAFNNVKSKIKVGMSEEEIALLIKIEHLKLGASSESFEPIVAFNENGANPHHINGTERKLTDKDQILIDMGCVYKKYCSDMTRVVFMKNVPIEQEMLYELVKNVALSCKSFGKIGMTFGDLNQKARDLLGMHEEKFNHTLSHGVGIDVHEKPLGKPDFGRKIEEGMIFTIEPGVYLPGKYGFRYEIMVVATPEGLIELK